MAITIEEEFENTVQDLESRQYSVFEHISAVVKLLYYLSPIGAYFNPESHEMYKLSYDFINQRRKNKIENSA